MVSQKLVRCEIVREGESNGEPNRGTVRYVPLDIFGLWEFLMRNRHRFRIAQQVASLWIDVDENPEVAYGEGQYERVTEVTLLLYSERDGMFGRVNRYFPTQECPELKKLLLKHYESTREPGAPGLQLRERHGIWIKRESRTG
jgi:hypothetical protein